MPFTQDEEDAIEEAAALKRKQIESLQARIAELQSMLDPLLASVARLDGIKGKVRADKR